MVLNHSRCIDALRYIASKMYLISTLFVVPVALVELTLDGESVREFYGFSLMLVGFSLGTQHAFWQSLRRNCNTLCVVTILAMLALQIGFVKIWLTGLHDSNTQAKLAIESIYLINKVLPIMAILALAYRFLNRPNDMIMRLNSFVFPLYIVHQSVIVAIAYWASTNMSLFWLTLPENQIWFTIASTTAVCVALLAVISRSNIL
jgi:hypothetical protein